MFYASSLEVGPASDPTAPATMSNPRRWRHAEPEPRPGGRPKHLAVLRGRACIFWAPTTNRDVEEEHHFERTLSFHPTAFDATLASGRPINLAYNHDPSRVLGSTADGVLEIRKHPYGLDAKIMLPRTDFGAWILDGVIERRIKGLSVGILTNDANREIWPIDGVRCERIRETTLREVSIADDPGFAECRLWIGWCEREGGPRRPPEPNPSVWRRIERCRWDRPTRRTEPKPRAGWGRPYRPSSRLQTEAGLYRACAALGLLKNQT